MKTRVFLALALILTVFCLDMPAEAEKKDNPADTKPAPQNEKIEKIEKPAAEEKKSDVKPSVTEHVIKISGKEIKYTATAGYLELKDEKEKKTANVFYVSYVKNDEKDLARRPVTFSFNGGPGSSSVWLHLGALGPKRVLMSDDGEAMKPPFRLVENESSWLDMTDLVFIDPVWTGFSRPAADQEKKQFHGVTEDIASVGEFIRLYTTRNERWLSPKFLAGESYGTTRAAGLAEYLQNRLGMEINGMFLISAVLDFKTISLNDNNDLPYVMFFPTFAATARYHLKPLAKDESLERYLTEVRAWAESDYFMALAKGNSLDQQTRRKIVNRISEYTGLSKEFIENSNLRISIFKFVKELLRKQKRTVGRFDSRIKGIDRDVSDPHCDYDPSYAAVQGTFTACLNHYIRNELKFETDVPYEILTGKVYPWNWGSASSGYVDVSEALRKVVCRNRFVKVFIGCGYFDLATPFFGIEQTIRQLPVEQDILSNFVFRYYEAGHMMYTHRPSLLKLKEDAAEFISSTLK